MSEWIEHDGKGMPFIPTQTMVDVWFRDGRMDKGFSAGWYAPWGGSHDHWTHENSKRDIVAYRLPPNPNQPSPEQQGEGK